MPRKTNHIISIQSIPDELWDNVNKFLDGHELMGKSDLGRKAIENYIRLAREYGIDANWNIQIPDEEEGERKQK